MLELRIPGPGLGGEVEGELRLVRFACPDLTERAKLQPVWGVPTVGQGIGHGACPVWISGPQGEVSGRL